MTLPRRLAAEGLGTALLVATVVGSGIMADRLTTDSAVALMGNTVPTGAILFVLITVLAPISGAHFNPAVTAVFAVRGDISWRDAGGYAIAQVIGGMAGSVAAHLMYDLAALQVATNVRTGPSQWLSEAIAAFGLVAIIIGGLQVRPRAIPALVGLYITAAYWFTASTSFANPAVTIGRALTDTFSGIRPIDAPGFIIAQFGGAFLALLVAGWLFKRRQAAT
jgi:glycerol uptake facilitator-like aquaporin